MPDHRVEAAVHAGERGPQFTGSADGAVGIRVALVPTMTNYVSPLLFMALLIPGGLIAARIAMTNLRAGIVLIVTKAEGDKEAAVNLAAAATTMATSPGAMHLRTLQTIDGLGPSASNTVVLALPVELMEIVNSLKDGLRTRRS
jgi:hypothetical protein